MVSFPYYSHTIPISLGILMGIVWEAYHKGVPENPTEYGLKPSTRQNLYFSFSSKCPVDDGNSTEVHKGQWSRSRALFVVRFDFWRPRTPHRKRCNECHQKNSGGDQMG